MVILPAIDLIKGQCVRLEQGRFDAVTVFDEDPVAVAKRFEADGAEWIHVVDLDGAREGKPQNLETIRAIREAVGLKMEVGGGIRTTETAEEMLKAGVERVIVGTRAVQDPGWLASLARCFSRRVALGLDARSASGGPEARIAVAGWGDEIPKTVVEFIGEVGGLPLSAIIYTDIERDGMMTGPNFTGTEVVVKVSPLPVIASGGVTTAEDIHRLKKVGAAGAIVGRALYEGKLALKDALKAARD